MLVPFFSSPAAGLTNQRPVRDSDPGAPLIGIGTGNPGVSQSYPYPNPSLSVPVLRVRVLMDTGCGFLLNYRDFS